MDDDIFTCECRESELTMSFGSVLVQYLLVILSYILVQVSGCKKVLIYPCQAMPKHMCYR